MIENDQPLVFSGKLSIDDFEKYNMFHARIAFVAMFLLVFLLTYLFLSDFFSKGLSLPTVWDIIIAVFFGLVGVMVLLLKVYRMARKSYRSESLMKLSQTYTVSESGVMLETDQSNVKYQWSDIRSIHELNDMFLLYVALRKAMVIPKRYFHNTEDLETFKLFLSNRATYTPKANKKKEHNKESAPYKLLAAIPHGIALIPVPIFNFTITIVYWSILKYKSDFISHHGKQAFNFQVSFTIYSILIFGLWLSYELLLPKADMLISLLITFLVIAFIVAGSLFYLVTIIVAIIAALVGKEFKYPISIPFIR